LEKVSNVTKEIKAIETPIYETDEAIKHNERNIKIKNRCQFCYNPIIEIPFKCQRCGLSYCGEHRLPENHQCGLKQYRNKQYETNIDLIWILIIVIIIILGLGIVIGVIKL
jgi:hypothetical protein